MYSLTPKQIFCIPLLIILSFGLTSCGGSRSASTIPAQDGPPSEHIDVASIPDAVPKPSSRSKYGNPDSYVVFGQRYYVMPSSKNYKERGIASWYGSKFHGQRTSSGEPYDMHAMTAAHKTLPLPTYVKVTNLKNGRQVILKVNDRGPFHENRIIDLSYTAAVKLGITGTGTGLVEVAAITPGQPSPPPANISDSPEINSSVAIYLQLGAFISTQNAHQLKNRVNLAIQGKQAHISDTLKDGQHFYRVRFGPLSSAEQADKLSLILNQKGFNKHRVVIE